MYQPSTILIPTTEHTATTAFLEHPIKHTPTNFFEWRNHQTHPHPPKKKNFNSILDGTHFQFTKNPLQIIKHPNTPKWPQQSIKQTNGAPDYELD